MPLAHGYSYLSVVSPLHQQKIMVWYAISSKQTNDPIFFNGMIAGMKYRELLVHHFCPKAGRLNVTCRYWFFQDGACLHRTVDVFALLETTFDEKLIAFNAKQFMGHGIEWSPYSADQVRLFLMELHRKQNP